MNPPARSGVSTFVTDIPVSGERVAAAEDFPDFYLRHCQALTAYVYQLTRDAETARDVAQEAFTRLLARWVTIREPKAYVFHVATNLVRDSWKARTRRQRVVEWLGHFANDVVPPPDAGLADAVHRLPRRYAEVVLLHYYSDLPLAEVAAAVRRPEGTVKRLLAEARVRLAHALEDPR